MIVPNWNCDWCGHPLEITNGYLRCTWCKKSEGKDGKSWSMEQIMETTIRKIFRNSKKEFKKW